MQISTAQALAYLTHFAATIVCLRKDCKEAGWVLLHLLVVDIGLFGLSIYLSGHPKPYPVGAARAAFFRFTSMYLAPPVILAAAFPTRITSLGGACGLGHRHPDGLFPVSIVARQRSLDAGDAGDDALLSISRRLSPL